MASEQDGPPRFADPRRLGAVVGLAGAVVFAFSYSPAEPVALVARVLVGATVAAAVPLPAGRVRFEPSWSAVPEELAARARPGDLVLTLGAGDVTQVGPEVLRLL